MPRIKDLQNYTGALNRADIFFAVDGNSFSRGMSMSGQQVHTLCKGIDGKNIELRSNNTHIQWRWEGDSTWANLIAVSSLKGEDGKELEIRVQAGYIQTRLTGGTWSNLIDLESLKGPKGNDAVNPDFTFQVNALAPDATPTSDISGTYPNLTVTLGLPKGHDAALPNFTFQVDALTADATPTSSISGTYPNLLVTLGIPKGHDAALPAFTFETEKGNPGTNPDVSVTGSYPDLNLKFRIPEGLRGDQGKPLVVLANGNYGNWDELSADYVDSGVTASATVDIENATVSFTESATRENLNTGEKVPALFGKIKKWFSDFGALAWKTKVDYQSDIDNLPTLVTSTDINNAINTHNTDNESHSDIRASLTTLQQNALTALRVHEGTGISVTQESDGSITLSADVDAEIFVTVTELPETGLANKIYLLPKSEGQVRDILDEYIWINNNWELIGSVSIDLTNYCKKPESSVVILQMDHWVNEEAKWVYKYEHADLKNTSVVWLTPSHNSEEDYTDAGVYSLGETQNGYFEIYARNQPIDDLTIGISIIN